MWIEAITSTEDLQRSLSEFAPVRIRLGDRGRELALESPSQVSLVADQGARIVCAAHLHWPFLGVNVRVTMKSLVILVRPVIEAHPSGDALVFKLEIEHADFAFVPTVIDNRITAVVNAELAKKHVELSWRYADTLDHLFHLPESLHPVESLALVATRAAVKVTNEAVGLAVSLRCHVLRGDNPRALESTSRNVQSPLAPQVTAGHRATPTTARLSAVALSMRGGIAALALGAAFALGRAMRHGHGWLVG
jgi:hypothetical protein